MSSSDPALNKLMCLKRLVDSTKDEDESKMLYVNKLGLTLGRVILRPKLETQPSIQDEHPTRSLCFSDSFSFN